MSNLFRTENTRVEEDLLKRSNYSKYNNRTSEEISRNIPRSTSNNTLKSILRAPSPTVEKETSKEISYPFPKPRFSAQFAANPIITHNTYSEHNQNSKSNKTSVATFGTMNTSSGSSNYNRKSGSVGVVPKNSQMEAIGSQVTFKDEESDEGLF